MTKQAFSGPRFVIPTYTVRVRGEVGLSTMRDPSGIQGQADAYLSSRPGAVVDVEYSEQCGHCRGAGRVLKSRRTLTWAPCKHCGGQPDLLPDIRVASIAGQAWSPLA